MLNIISLGAGIQSTRMALMAAHGEITPMPDYALFADTKWEPKAVYAHLKRLIEVLPFRVLTVNGGNILDHIQRNNKRNVSVPWFLGNGGTAWRQCTREFKVDPLQRKMRELLGYKPRERIPANSVSVWIGISMDEAIRMKPAHNLWQVNRWPLIEKRITRRDCQTWFAENGWIVPKSSCVGCPYHDNNQWRELRDNAPADWAEAVSVDKALRNGANRGMDQEQYMHRSLVPLDKVDLRTDAELGQGDLFNNECEGMCGV